jgi:hypothetical protein
LPALGGHHAGQNRETRGNEERGDPQFREPPRRGGVRRCADRFWCRAVWSRSRNYGGVLSKGQVALDFSSRLAVWRVNRSASIVRARSGREAGVRSQTSAAKT